MYKKEKINMKQLLCLFLCFILCSYCYSAPKLNSMQKQNTAEKEAVALFKVELDKRATRIVDAMILHNARFKNFLRNYKKQKNNIDAMPVIRFDRIITNAAQYGLNSDNLYPVFRKALENTKKVSVTDMEGAYIDKAARLAFLRERCKEDSKGKLIPAADLAFQLRITTETKKQNDKTVVIVAVIGYIVNIKNGLIVSRYQQNYGYEITKKQKNINKGV